jgi:hypothetical protein
MIDQVTAHHLFEYKDGVLYWKNAQRPSFNGKKAGYDNGSGYKKVSIYGKQYYAHRIIYLMQHGVMPKLVDHIDGNPSNNAIENLREANSSQNMMNSFQKANNLSGHRNVRYNKDRHNYSVYITLDGKQTFFGSYDDVELAGLVADEARRKHHGEFFFARSIN